jgi:phosphate transport system substrate-binding protein
VGNTDNPVLPVREGELVAGKYRVERVLGSGSMGMVVAARHLQLDQRVAIKFVREDVLASDHAASRFIFEARAVVKLKSEHVAKVTDVGALPSGAPYMVMELLEGSDLATVVEERGPLPTQLAADFIVQACEALAEAHAFGIVHRDLKPHNLFLAKTVGGAPKIKVLDFGVSKALSASGSSASGLAQTQGMIGSPLYMSPEQMRSSRDVDARSDVWSLGVVLYELLTRAHPFEGESMPELCLKVVAEPHRPITQLRSDLPEGLLVVIDRCLAKDPAQRYANAAELATALESFVPAASQAIAERARMAIHSSPSLSDSFGIESVDASSPTIPSPPVSSPSLGGAPTRSLATSLPTAPRRGAWMVGAALAVAAVIVAVLVLHGPKKEAAMAASAPPPASQPLPPPPPVKPPLVRLHGSNTIGAELVPALAEAYLAKKTGAKVIVRKRTGPDEVSVEARDGDQLVDSIEVFAHGSATAFEDLASSRCDIGMASRRVKAEEAKKLGAMGDMESAGSEHVIALDGIAIVVNPSNPIVKLTKAQLADLFSGTVRDWQGVGGSSHPVAVYARDDKSGTYDTFKNLVLRDKPLLKEAKRFESSEELSDAVAGDAGGIGFIGLPYVRSAKAVMVQEAGSVPLLPSPLTVSTEDYPLARRLYLYSPSGAPVTSREFIDFALSEEGQRVVKSSGFVDLTPQCNASASRCTTCTPQYRDAVRNACRLSVNFRFNSGSTALDTRALRDLQRIVTLMGRPESASRALLLFGFSDAQGDGAQTVSLSQQRAALVADQLRARGLFVDSTLGFGAAMPVADDSTEEGRQKNRRVEVWLR